MKTIRTIAWVVGLPLRIGLSALLFAVLFPLVPADYNAIVGTVKELWKRP